MSYYRARFVREWHQILNRRSLLTDTNAVAVRYLLTEPEQRLRTCRSFASGSGYSDYKPRYSSTRFRYRPNTQLENFQRALGAFTFFVAFVLIPDWSAIYADVKGFINKRFSTSGGSGREVEQQTRDVIKNESDTESDVSDENKPKLKKRVGFRDQRIIEYENRLRMYSTPEKVFRYFATLKVYHENEERAGTEGFDIFMTPEDFVRSLSPGVMQPAGLGLDHYITHDPKKTTSKLTARGPKDSIFSILSEYGLISFSDYIFLLTVLSTSPRHFELAFKMFDANGDGTLDYEEFEKVDDVVRGRTAVGTRLREHPTPGCQLHAHHNSALAKYFFGKELDCKLTIKKFLEFHHALQHDILRVEFERRDPDADGKISEIAFAEMLLMHSGLSANKILRMKKRVRKNFMEQKPPVNKKNESAKSTDELVVKSSTGITFDEISVFFCFITQIADVETALSFYNMAGASIDKATLHHVATTVADVHMSQHLVDVVFTLFDDNGDGELSNKEFIEVMKRRLHRGLQLPKDTGLIRMIEALGVCAVNNVLP